MVQSDDWMMVVYDPHQGPAVNRFGGRRRFEDSSDPETDNPSAKRRSSKINHTTIELPEQSDNWMMVVYDPHQEQAQDKPAVNRFGGRRRRLEDSSDPETDNNPSPKRRSSKINHTTIELPEKSDNWMMVVYDPHQDKPAVNRFRGRRRRRRLEHSSDSANKRRRTRTIELPEEMVQSNNWMMVVYDPYQAQAAVNRFEDSSDSANKRRRSWTTIELPEEMVCEIFLRFPVKSLIQFRCVSKGMCRMIDNPDFVKKRNLYRNNCQQSSNADDDDYAIIAHYGNSKKAIKFSDDLKSVDVLTDLVPPPYYYPDLHIYDDNIPTVFLGCCNGILVFQEEDEISDWNSVYHFDENRRLLLWNPSNNTSTSTSRYIISPLPVPPRSLNKPIAVSVGYDNVNDDYKVIYSIFSEKSSKFFMCYSLRKDRWKPFNGEFLPGYPTPIKVGGRNNANYRSSKWAGICVSSALHWFWKNPAADSSRFIGVYDLVSESFRSLALPEIPRRLGMRPIRLLDFGGRLCVAFSRSRQDDDDGTPTVWVMEKYGIETSWTPMYTGGKDLSFCYFPNKESHLLLVSMNKKLKWWDPVEHSLSKVDTKCGAHYEYVIYKRNLVRLDSL